MTSLPEARALALALPEAAEADHHGIASFRVRGRIFATVPDGAHLRVMLDEAGIEAAVAERPDACEPLRWGRRLAAVVVDLERVPASFVAGLLDEAWRRKAPASLLGRVMRPPTPGPAGS